MMMSRGRRRSEATERYEERRKREHEAQRLRDRVPSLATLRLDVAEGRGETASDPKHSRLIMVDTGPALFTLRCGDPSCRDGGHDLTASIMRGLLAGQTTFETEQNCEGTIGTAQCGRHMRVAVTATYRPAPSSS